MTDEVDNGITEQVMPEETPVVETVVETPEVVEKPTIEQTARKAVEALEEREKADRARGPDGKFIKAESAETPAPAKESAKAVVTTDQPAIKPLEAAKPIEPPQSWSAAAKALWGALPPEVQQEIAKREGDVAKGFEQKANETKAEIEFAKSIRQKFEPDRAELQAAGADEGRAIDYLLEMHRFAKRDPQGYLLHAAKALNVDLSHLVQPTQPGETPYVDPELAALRQELAQLKGGLSSLTTAQQQAQQAEITGRINSFKSQTNQDGTPKFPHFDTVRYTMGVLMQSGQAKDMDEAYDMAVYAKPELRAQLLADKAKQEEEQRRKEAAEKANAARKAAGTTLSPKASTTVQPARKKTIEETAREVGERMFSAA